MSTTSTFTSDLFALYGSSSTAMRTWKLIPSFDVGNLSGSKILSVGVSSIFAPDKTGDSIAYAIVFKTFKYGTETFGKVTTGRQGYLCSLSSPAIVMANYTNYFDDILASGQTTVSITSTGSKAQQRVTIDNLIFTQNYGDNISNWKQSEIKLIWVAQNSNYNLNYYARTASTVPESDLHQLTITTEAGKEIYYYNGSSWIQGDPEQARYYNSSTSYTTGTISVYDGAKWV